MRFRFTLLLLIANIALFFAIWSLERQDSAVVENTADTVPFTVFEIYSGENQKPKIVKFENNKWKIISPINWDANIYTINKIRSQLEFIGKETSFPVSELSDHGRTLADYGLDKPAYIVKYGNGSLMKTLKIGKASPVGDRIYMLDEGSQNVVVVDRAFVNSLIVSVESLRNMSIFYIPPFEVSAFSIRIPLDDSSSGKLAFKTVWLEKDAGKWKFKSPITASADTRAVDSFLNELCQLSATSFLESSVTEDISALPTSVTIQGTNRQQVLQLGSVVSPDGTVKARLEDNPTVFTLDSSILKKLTSLQNDLRDKRIMNFDTSQVVGVDISKAGHSIKLRKLKEEDWDVIGLNSKGDTLTANADLKIVHTLLSKLNKLRFISVVRDVADNADYGLDNSDTLQIVVTMSDQSLKTVRIGNSYKYGAVSLRYASVNKDQSIYGISNELSRIASTDFYHYRSRILEIMPSTAKLLSVKIIDIKSGNEIFSSSISSVDSKLSERTQKSFKVLAGMLKIFTVKDYLKTPFSDAGAIIENGKIIPWHYELIAEYELQGTGTATSIEKRSWLITERIGGTTQYGGSKKNSAEWTLTQPMIDAFSNLTLELKAPEQLQKSTPNKPEPITQGSSSDTILKK